MVTPRYTVFTPVPGSTEHRVFLQFLALHAIQLSRNKIIDKLSTKLSLDNIIILASNCLRLYKRLLQREHL
jgi:hypothetical protein